VKRGGGGQFILSKAGQMHTGHKLALFGTSRARTVDLPGSVPSEGCVDSRVVEDRPWRKEEGRDEVHLSLRRGRQAW
jgi:hypothetical protein